MRDLTLRSPADDAGDAARRNHRTNWRASSRIASTHAAVTPSAATGNFSASIPRPTANASSPRLKSQFENGSGLTLTAARVPAFVKWLLAAKVPPASAVSPCTKGDASPSVDTAMRAPPTGRTSVCTVSHRLSTHGTLSATNSTRYNASAPPMIQLLSNAAN